ncbi:MAG: membrane dipeptidase [Chloroflexota bacterium]|nr:membrane dipeptidase [Chloroflexota bacterium]
MLTFDLHLDLAMSAVQYNRDLLLSIADCRASEAGIEGKSRAHNTVTFPEMRRGHVGLCIATVLARVQRSGSPGAGTGFRTHEIAYAVAQGMLAYYRQLERMGVCRLIRSAADLAGAAAAWETDLTVRAQSALSGLAAAGGAPQDSAPPDSTPPDAGEPIPQEVTPEPADGPPFGFILGTEGADCIVAPSQLPLWWEEGLRVVSLVHYGVSKYAHGTGADGPLTADGRDLLRAMDELGAVLDVTHQCDASFWESLERFRGPVLASHQNCRALVPGDRQMDDDQLRALIQRGAVIGAALDNWMLYPGYVRGETPNTAIALAAFVDHIDHVCQLAGNARHAAIGSDLDGGYGYEQTPHDLNTIADLHNVPPLLAARGYSTADVADIMGGNVVRFFQGAL